MFPFVAAGTAVVYLLPFLVPATLNSVVVEPTSVAQYLTAGNSVDVPPATPEFGVPSRLRVTVLAVGPVLLCVGGMVGFVLRWRRDYEVRVTVPEGFVR